MPTDVSGRPRLKIRLTPAAESAVRAGHPWIFAGSVKSQNRPGATGEMAVVYDRHDRFLALGMWEEESPIRLRVLHKGKPVTVDEAWWRGRWQAALARRAVLETGPARTDGFRLINGESDGWPGVVLDRYADTIVLKLYSAAWLSRLELLRTLLREATPCARAAVLRLSRHVAAAARPLGVEEGFLFSAETPPREVVIFTENGLRFEAAVRYGQKTGFFLDQRDNRSRVGELARGAEVLNAFSFSGGFSLYAARGGARRVVDLDLSEHALAAARRNKALNAHDPRVAAAAHETIAADAFEWLASGPRRRFDLIIVDPPSLAPREENRTRAVEAYARLNASALRRLKPGGVLVAASCSAHVRPEEFFRAVRRAAAETVGDWEELWTSGHAVDHPAHFPEAEYLKALALRRRS